MLYNSVIGAGPLPGISLDRLIGSFNPSFAGFYTYTPLSDLFLSSGQSDFPQMKLSNSQTGVASKAITSFPAAGANMITAGFGWRHCRLLVSGSLDSNLGNKHVRKMN
jgi:hypothetical protein